MTIRTPRERLYQAAGYEIGGLLLAIPFCSGLTGAGLDSASLLVVTMTVATILWTPLVNLAFDRLEWRLRRRPASDRTIRMRVVHAVVLETSDIVVTVPILMVLGGLSPGEAVMTDLGLTAVYVLYSYAYHLAFDRLRPVATARVAQGLPALRPSSL